MQSNYTNKLYNDYENLQNRYEKNARNINYGTKSISS